MAILYNINYSYQIIAIQFVPLGYLFTMRVGTNPAKAENELVFEYLHRVVIAIYIPNLEGYFTHSLKILKLCLDSVIQTIDDRTAITLIDNASCTEVKSYLESLYAGKKIDQLIINKENNGKIDPLLSVIRGCHEPFITIADADVLFVNGWQKEVFDVFKNFPMAGMVSPVPTVLSLKSYTNSTIGYGLYSGKLKFDKLCLKEDLLKFANSVGWPDNTIPEANFEQQLCMQQGDFKSIVGCGHFVATLRKEVFDFAPKEPSRKKIGGHSPNKYIDVPNDKAGYLRLATVKNYAYHMGNSLEDWFYEIAENNKIGKTDLGIDYSCLSYKMSRIRRRLNYFSGRIVIRLIKNRTARIFLYRFWKLNPKYYNGFKF